MNKMFLSGMMTLLLFASASGGHAADRSVPKLLAFRSLMYDNGGNLIPSGETKVTFRITDISGNTLYKENQTPDSYYGEIAALIGNGLDDNGAPAGPIPTTVFDPIAPRFVEAQIEGEPPTSLMEIASVPYSIFASEALSASEGAIDSKAIKDQGVEYDDLSADLISKLSNEMTGGKGAGNILYKQDLATMYRNPTSAENIGIKPQFYYTGANDLQHALTDLDRAIVRRDEKINSHANTATGVHGIGNNSSVVGTNTVQTLTNKTLQGGTISADIAVNDSVKIDGVDVSELPGRIDGKVSKSGDTMSGELKIPVPVPIPAGVDGGVIEDNHYKTAAALSDLYVKSGGLTENIAANAAAAAVDKAAAAPGLAKAWGYYSTNAAGVPTLIKGYNVVSVSQLNIVEILVTFTVPMQNANYLVLTTPENSQGNPFIHAVFPTVSSKTANGISLVSWDGTNSRNDNVRVYFVVYDQ